MNEHIDLYSWIRRGDSILLASISDVQLGLGEPGQEKVRITLAVEEQLWGGRGELRRQCEFERPAAEQARLKFPHPVWGRVTVQKGTRILFVTAERGEVVAKPVYVEDVRRSDEPQLAMIRAIINAEKTDRTPNEKAAQYMKWLHEMAVVPTLFAAQALAQDANLAPARHRIDVINALIQCFLGSPQPYVRISVGTWLWKYVYPEAPSDGRVAIFNALVRGLTDGTPNVRNFALDTIVEVSPADLPPGAVVKNRQAAGVLQAALAKEPAQETRSRIQALIEIIRE